MEMTKRPVVTGYGARDKKYSTQQCNSPAGLGEHSITQRLYAVVGHNKMRESGPDQNSGQQMQTQDFDVLEHAADWCQGGEPVWLCTIVAAIGSSPRPVGSLLVCHNDGRQVGSVSGGCVEEDLLQRLRAGEFTGTQAHIIEYGVSAEENERLGLPCGGRLHLLVQTLGQADLDWLNPVLESLAQRTTTQRQLDLSTGKTFLSPVARFIPLQLDSLYLRQCFGARMRMLLVGAGQLAQSLAELATAMDYEVIVTDPRREILAQWEGPAVPLLQGMPDDIVREQVTDQHSIVITLTHDPRIDDMALMEALTTDAWYIGALGSSRTTQKRLLRLAQLGLAEGDIAKLHAPVGLDIGSKTPIEIAVAIMAELTQLRRRSIV
jgi:xanthine dehydrogenase accessory factor